MAYTVLARKYRSRTFDEVVGQQPIATTLVNAIKADRIHHGYLFTGTRGVGKTSMARILAKALNCLDSDSPTATPCLKCDACKAIGEGQDIDVVEIDAASNTGVENIRDLRSSAAYRPARSRFKVYIIDEVHMLSTGAFNALLKTLEEPPEHVKFILATTEIQKVPATIQSRCQRFNFQNIGPSAIADRLAEIVQAEGFQSDDQVIRRVARLAGGSMRDALSILDQLLSVATDKLTPQVLDEVLPPSQDERIFKLFQQAAAADVAGVLTTVEEMLSTGRSPELVCGDAAEFARSLMHLLACGAETELVDLPAGDREPFVALSREFTLSQYVQIIGLLEELRRNVRYSGAGRALLDAGLVRLTKLREWSAIEELLPQLAASAEGDEKKKPAALAPRAEQPQAATPTQPPPPERTAKLSPQPKATPQQPAESAPRPASAPHRADGEASTPAPAAPAPAAPAPRAAPAAQNLTEQEKAAIRKDPTVQQALELLDGQLVFIGREAAAETAEADEPIADNDDDPEME